MIILPKEERALRKTFDILIKDVEVLLLKESPIYKVDKDSKKTALSTTALSNLIGVAQTASCLKQLQLFIEYQAARDSKKWNKHHFATNLIKRFDPDKLLAITCKEALQGLNSEGEAPVIWLAVQYLGFIRRKFMYLREFLGGETQPKSEGNTTKRR